MFKNTTALFVATLVSLEDCISGSLSTAATKGLGITYAATGATINDDDELALANEGDGYVITRDHIASEDFDRTFRDAHLHDRENIETPTVVDRDQVSGHRVLEAIYEGDTFLDASVDDETVAGQKLYWKNGKLAENDGSKHVAGYVIKQLTPVDLATNGRRILVRLVRG